MQTKQCINVNIMEKKLNNFSGFIGVLMFVSGITLFIGSIIDGIVYNGTDIWFSRFAMSLVCFGIAGIIFKKDK